MRAFWEKLGSRQKHTIIAGGVLILVILFVQLALLPFLDNRQKIRRSITVNEAALKQMYVLDAEYRSLKGEMESVQKTLAARPPEFSFFSFVEKKAGEAGIRGNIKSLQPSKPAPAGPFEEISADIKFEKVTLKQIVDFLAAVESPANAIALKRLAIGRSTERADYLSVQMRLTTLQVPRGESAPAGKAR